MPAAAGVDRGSYPARHAQGRVVSRGSGIIRPGFGSGPTAFEVDLAPTGGETEFRLRVVRLQQYARPNR